MLSAGLLAACTGAKTEQAAGPHGHFPFTHLPPIYGSDSLVLAPGLRYQILFQKGDTVQVPGQQPCAAKGYLDYMALFRAEEDYKYVLWVNHEDNTNDDCLGDGGGASLVDMTWQNGTWQVNGRRGVDFRPVGGTWKNCLGVHTPWNTVLTSEENEPADNAELYKKGEGTRDTTPKNGMPAYLNQGWAVEADPITGKVLGKRWELGRFSHEGATFSADGITVYMADDYAPGVFFKYVYKEKGKAEGGQLYAWGFTGNGPAGKWLPLPMTREALAHARREALKLGATFFIRLEDCEKLPDGRFVLSETGKDNVDLTATLALGGKPSPYLAAKTTDGKHYDDVHGRLLVYDPKKETIELLLECGMSADSSYAVSNPDNLVVDHQRGLLYICEDNNEPSRGRVPAKHEGTLYNELYCLDLSVPAPTVNSLARLLATPAGSEPTGILLHPEGNGMFVNIQHPAGANPGPWNRDATLYISGFAPAAK